MAKRIKAERKRIEAERKRIDAEWIDAFGEETGYQLMTLLRQEPRLLTIKYCGCNVLHLAMRHNWYSLVLEILRKFKHLYKDASFLYRGFSSRSEVQNHREDTEDFQSSSTVDSQATTGDLHSKDVCGLDLASFRDLLEAKEGGGETLSRGKGAKWKYESGLDVFAMAVIQGDAAINTLLAEAVLQVDGLFDHPHPYKDVVRFIGEEPEETGKSNSSPDPHGGESEETGESNSSPDRHGEELEETGESNSSPDRHKEERKLLREIIEACFPVPHRVDVRIDHEFETISKQPHEQQTATDSQTTPATSGPKQLEHPLAGKIDPELIQEWGLTSRFLPLEEFLFLACFSVRNRMLKEKTRHEMFEAYMKSRKGKSFKKYLLGIKDTRGSAVHHMVRSGDNQWIWEMTRETNYTNGYDGAGRTSLYIALALGHMRTVAHYDSLREQARIVTDKTRIVNSLKDINKECGHWQFKGRIWQADVAAVSAVNHYSPYPVFHKLPTNALHVIIRSPHLSDDERSWLTSMCLEGVRFIDQIIKCPTFPYSKMTWLMWAAYMGDTTTLEILADDDKIYDPSRLKNLSLRPEDFWMTEYDTVLHAAAAAGHPHAIRTILATGKFDPLVQDDNGNTALHLATHFPTPLQFPYSLADQFPYSLADFCEIPDGRIGTSYQVESSLSTEERKDLLRIGESRRQGCINLLLQAGIDIWQTNLDKKIADPGPKASAEYSTWWYDKMSKETQEARTSLNAAANAISVTAALVATASYGGPLQPPLGYAVQSEDLIDKMQVGVLSVRIFIVCNTLAFYLALAAILLSLTPSLPMPQESILDELKVIRRTVTLAVGLLILSMVAILVAFASASIAVIPDEGSWNHGGLTVSTLGVGGSICILVLVLCLFRLLRLVFHKRTRVRRFYNKYWSCQAMHAGITKRQESSRGIYRELEKLLADVTISQSGVLPNIRPILLPKKTATKNSKLERDELTPEYDETKENQPSKKSQKGQAGR